MGNLWFSMFCSIQANVKLYNSPLKILLKIDNFPKLVYQLHSNSHIRYCDLYLSLKQIMTLPAGTAFIFHILILPYSINQSPLLGMVKLYLYGKVKGKTSKRHHRRQ